MSEIQGYLCNLLYFIPLCGVTDDNEKRDRYPQLRIMVSNSVQDIHFGACHTLTIYYDSIQGNITAEEFWVVARCGAWRSLSRNVSSLIHELVTAILRKDVFLAVCPGNSRKREVLLTLIKKHVIPGTKVNIYNIHLSDKVKEIIHMTDKI